jgi:DegV family protein with EDD domain
MDRVAVVTDSTADLPVEIVNELGIHVVPLNVRIGHESFEDRVTITPSEFMQRLQTTDEFPTTSQPSVGRFQQLYSRLAADHDSIISIHISSKLSGTYQSACMARDNLADDVDIRVIDSQQASMAIGFPVIRAARMASCGKRIDEIEQAVSAMLPRVHLAFLVDTLEYLRRGGRIGRAAEVVGSILKLKPILRLEEGIVVPYSRTRTRARALAGMLELVKEIPRIESIALIYTAGTTDVNRIVDSLAPLVDKDGLFVSELSPVLSAHIGPGGIGIAVQEGDPG